MLKITHLKKKNTAPKQEQDSLKIPKTEFQRIHYFSFKGLKIQLSLFFGLNVSKFRLIIYIIPKIKVSFSKTIFFLFKTKKIHTVVGGIFGNYPLKYLPSLLKNRNT